MPKRKTPEEIIEEQQRLAEVHKAHFDARMKVIEEQRRKIKETQRKRDTRRMVLMGSFLDECFKRGSFPITPLQARNQLLAYLSDDKDKALFNDEFWTNFDAFNAPKPKPDEARGAPGGRLASSAPLASSDTKS